MLELEQKSPCAGILPLQAGTVSLKEIVPEALWMLSPHQGKQSTFSAALEETHGLRLSDLGELSRHKQHENIAIFPFAPRQWMLMGIVQPDAALKKHASLSDQSDAWFSLMLEGPGSEDVLARLTSVDVSAAVFPAGSTARLQLASANAIMLRHAIASFQILAFRSMAEWLVEEIHSVMKFIAARHSLQQ